MSFIHCTTANIYQLNMLPAKPAAAPTPNSTKEKTVCTSLPATRVDLVVPSLPSRLVSVDKLAAESVRVDFFFFSFFPFHFISFRFFSLAVLSCHKEFYVTMMGNVMLDDEKYTFQFRLRYYQKRSKVKDYQYRVVQNKPNSSIPSTHHGLKKKLPTLLQLLSKQRLLPSLVQDSPRARELARKPFARTDARDDPSRRHTTDRVVAVPGHEVVIIDKVFFAGHELFSALACCCCSQGTREREGKNVRPFWQ